MYAKKWTENDTTFFSICITLLATQLLEPKNVEKNVKKVYIIKA